MAQIWVKPGHGLYSYFQEMCTNAKRLYNVTNYYIRQLYFALYKEGEWRSEQQAVMDTLKNALGNMNEIRQRTYEKRLKKEAMKPIEERQLVERYLFSLPTKESPFINDHFMDALFRVINEPSYRSLPTKSSQMIIKQVVANWKSYFALRKSYRQHPSLFHGIPRMPGYSIEEQKEIPFSNQQAVIKDQRFLKFPMTHLRLNIGKIGKSKGKLIQVLVLPKFGHFLVEITFAVPHEEIIPLSQDRVMAIDEGVGNLVALVTNTGMRPTLIKGGTLKSILQYYHKKKAHHQRMLSQGKNGSEKVLTSKRLKRLDRKRFVKINDYLHKVSKTIVEMASKEQIGLIVIGRNKGWKHESHMGKSNDQLFGSIPYYLLNKMILKKAGRKGIQVIFQEESYTSKASFLDRDPIPVYQKTKKKPVFSGRRIHRGLYRSAKGVLINADVNGAYNILRKAVPNGFTEGIEGLDRLLAVAVSTPLVIHVR